MMKKVMTFLITCSEVCHLRNFSGKDTGTFQLFRWNSKRLSKLMIRNFFNTLTPGDKNTHQWSVPALVQVMAWHQTGAKPLHEPNAGLLWIWHSGINFNDIKKKVFIQENGFGKILCILFSRQCVNSLRPSDAYMHQLNIIGSDYQAWSLADTNPLSEPMLEYYLMDPWEWTSVKYLSKYILIQENAFQNVVWKMAAILSRPQCVKSWLCWCIGFHSHGNLSLKKGKNGRHFTDITSNCIFM